jgi:hypothetical protein
MITESLKNAFWAAVAECLAEFHGRKLTEAKLAVFDLRARVENPPEEIDSDLVYHSEPFYVACDLAGEVLDIGLYAKEYDEILERNFGVLGVGRADVMQPRVQQRRLG